MLIVDSATYVACCAGAMAGNAPIRCVFRRIDTSAPGPTSLLGAQLELRGGRWIGVLERICVYLCVVTGFGAGIAMVLALKGLGRYPELRHGNSARVGELFIIGTLLSFLWAIAWAGIARGVVALT